MARKLPLADAVVPPVQAPAPKRIEKSREGKKGVAFWLNPTAAKQLAQIALDEDRSIQSLMEEATDLLFFNRGKYRLARGG
jgi:hypothetical protein